MECNTKRLAIYVTYNSQGVVDEYITYMIDSLKSVATDVFIVSNNYYLPEEKEKLALAARIYERENEEFDVGAFAYVINELIESKEIMNYDELIMINDSIFGPFFELTEMFEEMDARNAELDFWGITRRGKSNFDGGDSIYPEHVQTYFYVCKKRLLRSNDFMEYWGQITKKITGFRSAILNYEFAFTKHFEDLGYKWDTYCDCCEFITNNPQNNLSPYHYGMFELIKNQRCPFLKRKLFTGDFVEKQYTDSLDLKRAVDYIDKYTNYDVDLIWKHIIKGYRLSDIMEAMHLIEVIVSENSVISNDKLDIYNDSDFELNDLTADSTSDLLLYISIPASIEPYPLRKAYFNNIRENLLDSRYYLNEILELFRNEKFLGVVVPPVNTYGEVSKTIEKKWIDEDVFKEIMQKYNMMVPVSKEYAPIHEIKAFICRKEILPEGLLDDIKNDMTGTIMQMIPVFAQQAGFLTKILVNKNYVPALVDNILYLTSDLWRTKRISLEKNMTFKEMEDEVYKNQVRDFLHKVKTAYVYGAGQLAYRILDCVEDVENIAGVVVSDLNGNPEYVHGYKVRQIDEVTELSPNYIVAVGRKNNNVVLKNLKEKGMQNYLLID